MRASLWFLLFCLSSSVAAVEVHDALGRRVELPQPAQRIVSLAPHATEMLFAAGAGSQVVGVVEYSNYPEAATRLPRVGGYSRLDLEAILALKPDLVVVWSGGNTPDTIQRLKEMGLTLYFTEPRHLGQIADDIERLGQLSGHTAEASGEAAQMREGIARLRRDYSRRPTVSVFYQIWVEPLLTVNGEHLINEVIELCGGKNVFAEAPTLVPAVGVEAVLQANPDAVIASGMAEERPEWLEAWRRWGQLAAVRHQALFHIHPDLIQRQGPRILQGAEVMCRYLEQTRLRMSEVH